MEKTFRKRAGTTNKGVDYEIMNIANIAINLVNDENIQNFHISSNDEDFGQFDDIVVEMELEDGPEINAIQLKHIDRGELTVTQLTSQKGDFSIKKYFASSKTVVAAKLILFTNRKFHFEGIMKFDLNGEDIPVTVTKISSSKVFKLFHKEDYCYKFSIAENDSYKDPETILLYRQFFERFFLYPNQDDLQKIKKNIAKKFQTSFCDNVTEYNQFIHIVNEWNLQEGEKLKLNKNWIREEIALTIFASRIKPLSFNCGHDLEGSKVNILREAIEAFNITVFGEKSYDDLNKLWNDKKFQPQDLKIVNQLTRKYQPTSNHISEIDNADPLILNILLWLRGEVPLILKQDASILKVLKLCSDKKIILLGDDCANSLGENVRVFKTLADLKGKTSQYDHLVQKFTCSLQGKPQIPLCNLINGNEEILTLIKTDDLLQMVNSQCNICEDKEDLQNPYIERCVFKNVIDIKIIYDTTKQTAVVLDCMTQKSVLKKNITRYNFININDFLNSPPQDKKRGKFDTSTIPIYFDEKRITSKQFNALCEKIQNAKNVHQFRVRDDGNLEWIGSRGDVSYVERYKLPKNYTIEERDLNSLKFENTINLLVGEPGIGKSELMKSFKSNCFSECFTVLVKPKDVFSCFKNTRKSTNYVNAFQNFLLTEKYKTLPPRDKDVFRKLLEKNKFVYVWDALDELSEKDRNIAADIIVKLSKNCVQWVTSRGHLQNTLQRKFNVLSLSLKKFDESEQKDFIGRRLADVRPTEEVENIHEKIKSSFVLIEHKDILGIPLHIFMLTELLRQNRKKYLALLDNAFLLTDLYDYFIQEKIYILYRDKLGSDLATDAADKIVADVIRQLFEKYTKAAVGLLFPSTILKKLGILNREDFGYIDKTLGLVTEITNQMQGFIHNSFAEYLAALYFVRHPEHKKILAQVIFDPKYTNIRFFFDLLLAKDSKAHVAILYKDFNFIRNCTDSGILTKTDSGGRSVLHLACSWGQIYRELRVKYSFIRGTYEVVDQREFSVPSESHEYRNTLDVLLKRGDLYKTDELFHMTPREYARKTACLVAEMRIMMKRGVGKSVRKYHLINMLYYSIQCGYYPEFVFFFELFYKLKANLKLSQGVANNIKNHTGMNLLCIAAVMGRVKIVKYLVKAGGDINLRDRNGRTPLSWASWRGRQTIVKTLVKSGADVNIPDQYGQTPLYWASWKGKVTIVQMLLKAGANPNLADEDGSTPFHVACQEGHEETVEILIKDVANINLREKGGQTPLYWACWKGNVKIVQILLEAGANINLPSKEALAPLCVASEEGHETLVQMLVEKGADVNISDKDGRTPLHRASANGHERIVDILLEVKADVNHCDKDGFTPLYVASREGQGTTVEILLEKKAAVNYFDKDSFTPLYIASQKGNEKIVKMLLKADADSNLPGKDGLTPLYAASEKGHERIVEMLLEKGADTNLTNKESHTPLHVASLKGHGAVVEMLLKNGAHINVPDKTGLTPLHMASWGGQTTTFEMLLKAGADVNIADQYGRTPLHKASRRENRTVVLILLAIIIVILLSYYYDY